ncbi:MAG: ankyrin repeat domain-containing protein, partial [Gammaproteobacteria bacterium]|nr:ankyrin repeat domain-containing protein [Gammaproteobacteria bacterium]
MPSKPTFHFISAFLLLACLLVSQSGIAQSSRELALLEAVKAGDQESARVLLDGTQNVNSAEADGTTALHYAVLNNQLNLVAALIRSGADVNARTRYGITPIYLAARNGSRSMTQVLLNAGASANEIFNEGETVLMTAARTGDVDTVRVLLEAGAVVDAREDWHGQTPMMWAAAQKHAPVIALLDEYGADVNATSSLEKWERQVTMEPRDKWLPPGVMTPLHFAAREGCLDCIATLLELGADINATTP